jgi:hypothetical protein
MFQDLHCAHMSASRAAWLNLGFYRESLSGGKRADGDQKGGEYREEKPESHVVLLRESSNDERLARSGRRDWRGAWIRNGSGRVLEVLRETDPILRGNHR